MKKAVLLFVLVLVACSPKSTKAHILCLQDCGGQPFTTAEGIPSQLQTLEDHVCPDGYLCAYSTSPGDFLIQESGPIQYQWPQSQSLGNSVLIEDTHPICNVWPCPAELIYADKKPPGDNK